MSEGQGKTKRAGSVVGSIASIDSKSRPRSYPIWPEFNENDINSEKWVGGAGLRGHAVQAAEKDGGGGKGKEKGKSPNMQFFDDPEGRIDLPLSIKVDTWKRPHDFIESKIPTVVDNENFVNLMHPNEHLGHSQLMRTIISQVMSLWDISRTKPHKPEHAEVNPWLPWDHIYSLCKTGKGHMPLFNQFGKYVVRLYWMGAWRKIHVDDWMPFDADGKLLLPASTSNHELWPMLLSKALIKIAALDYNMASDVPELGDTFVIHCLTGWIPETVPLQCSHNNNVWTLLKKILPEWKLPMFDDKDKATPEHEPDVIQTPKATEATKRDVGSASMKDHKHEKGSGKDAKGGKESSRKRDEKEKNKSVIEEVAPLRPEDVQMLVFANFIQNHGSPAPMSLLRDMAFSSEHLRKIGLSHLHTHPVHISQTRSCSLVPPTPVPEVPRWKLIRPHKKKVPPSDEPLPEPTPPKPDQWLEIVSPYVGYRPPAGAATGPMVSSVSGGSLVLNEMDEEKDNTPEKKPKAPSSKPVPEPPRKGANLETPIAQRIPSPLPPSRVDASDAESMNKTELDETEEVEEQAEEEVVDTVIISTEVDVLKKTWIDYEDFCKTFTSVIIFHKPGTYPHSETAGEFKQVAMSAGLAPPQPSGKKGSANQAPSNTNVRASPVVPKSYEGFPMEERNPGFLFVDSCTETELVISYSVLPRWLGLDDKKTFDRESVAGASEAVSYKLDMPVVPSGLLVVEQYSWKNLVTGQPILRIRTTGTKASCLTLPAGRHVLRFVYNSPLGYHVHVCSTTKFMFGDEDAVMAPLQEESCRFVEAATNIMSCVEKSLDAFGNDEEFRAASVRLHKAHMPHTAETKLELQEHYAAWYNAFHTTVNAAMGDAKINSLSFGLRAFLLDFITSASSISAADSGVKDPPENWIERTGTDEETGAAEIIQRNWRGAYTRKIMRARNVPESPEQAAAIEVLKSVRSSFQNNTHTYTLMLLRNLLRFNPQLAVRFPFYKDEWHKIAFKDYNGTFSEQPPRTWFVVFREVFYAEKEMLCVPKIYVSVPTCYLRVVDNDTGEELKKVFQKVAPHVFKKNKRGYTFVAEARTLEQPLNPGKWKLRLIGAANPLPAPRSSQPASVFAVKEIKDYYIPNKSRILFRYTLKCNTNLVGSLQVQTSKSEAIVQFKIFDKDVELVSTRGKGHCVIPAFCFQTNVKERVSSGTSNNESKNTAPNNLAPAPAKGGKKAASAKKDGKASPVPTTAKKHDSEIPIAVDDVQDDNTYDHNYVIQAVVERKTWPLARSQWAFVEKLKEAEKEDMKAFPGGQRQSLSLKQGAPAEKAKKGSKAAPEKGGKDKKQADKEIGSRPSSQNVVDESRAYWSIRFVVDADVGEEFELKKDTQRLEEIRAMKQAWETAEPGRAVKAMQARLNYFSNNSAKDADLSDKENDDETEKSGEQTDASSEPPQVDDMELLFDPPEPSPRKSDSKPLDYSQHVRYPPPGVEARYVSAEELNAFDEEEQKRKTEAYNLKRSRSQAYRDNNRVERMILKEQQLESCKEMQYAMDLARGGLLKPRETYRQRLLEERRQREEAAEAAAAAALAASEATSPDVKGKKSGKKKK